MRRLVGLAIVLTTAAQGGAASAQSVCVECAGPARTYACSIKDIEKVQQFRGSQRARDFLCMTEIARVGGHQSCRIGTAFSGPCIGQPFEIDVTKPQVDQAEAAAKTEAGGQPAAADRKGPPETLEQLAKQTLAVSKEQMAAADEQVRKAGQTVGGVAQRTWTCVVSLFSKC